MSNVYLGIDTSNYKTSVAAVSEKGTVLYERSEFLKVKQGEKGLRQSDAFFQQSNKLPDFIKELFSVIDPSDVKAISVSSRPRRVEGSYMPCFLAGSNAAKEIAASLVIPVHEFSHQEGHASAVIDPEDDNVLFFHLSGGTTEFLKCIRDQQGYDMKIVGGTRDISFGQLLDRIGVKLGHSFPAGKYLDEIASSCVFTSKQLPKVKIEEAFFNLSGIETKCLRLTDTLDEDAISELINELFNMIADIIFRSAEYLSDKFNILTVYIAGGVASSITVRKRIAELCDSSDRHLKIRFGSPHLSGDNAVGTAKLGIRASE